MASLLKFKPTVVAPRVCFIIAAAVNAKNALGFQSNTYVTSQNDSLHMKGSKHYEDCAVDFRTNDMSKADVQRWAVAVRGRLGAGYDVVIEADHLHVEYDPA